MPRMTKSSAAFAVVLGAILAVSYAFGVILAGRVIPGADRSSQKVATAEEPMVPVIEGGVHAGGYIDGRPVPSGFEMPVVIRWRPKEQAKPPIEPAVQAGVTP
jgi:hypothetical protein